MLAFDVPLSTFADLNGGEIAWRLGANVALVSLLVTVFVGRRVLGAFGSVLVVAGGVLGWAAVQVAIEGGNRAGVVLVGGASVALVSTALLGTRAGVRSLERIPATAGPAHPVGIDSPPSAWPAALAMAAVVVVLGVATHPVLLVVGFALLILSLVGWFGANWNRSELANRDVADAMAQRVVAPLGVPIGALALLLFVAVAVSRLLLAVTKNGALAVGGAVAIAVLGACTLVALAPANARWLTRGMIVLAVLTFGLVGAVGTSEGEREFEAHGGGVETITVKAQAEGLAFDTTRIVLPIDEDRNALEAVLILDNRSAVAHHNISIYSKDPAIDANGDTIADGATAVFNGSWAAPLSKQRYYINPLDADGNPVDIADRSAGVVDPAGEPYFFQCDIHQNMRGTVEFEVVHSEEGDAKHGGKAEGK